MDALQLMDLGLQQGLDLQHAAEEAAETLQLEQDAADDYDNWDLIVEEIVAEGY